ncbi:MAG: UTRA domain-containing protein [Pseudomonadota bacterium]
MAHTHETIGQAIRKRITRGEWPPGSIIPREQDLSEEYGCARATVNRALRKLADDGLVERKRRAGTRVAEFPAHHARIKIPILRLEVEAAGAVYRPQVTVNEILKAPLFVRGLLHLNKLDKVLHLETIHLANDKPFAFEDRWVNLNAAPGIVDAPLDRISANEWLIHEVAFSDGSVSFGASNATKREADALYTEDGAALFTIKRRTWKADQYITAVTLYFRPGYEMHAT